MATGVYCKYKCGTRLTSNNMLTHESSCARNDKKFSKDLGIMCRKEVTPFGTCTQYYDKDEMMEHWCRKKAFDAELSVSEARAHELAGYLNKIPQQIFVNPLQTQDQILEAQERRLATLFDGILSQISNRSLNQSDVDSDNSRENLSDLDESFAEKVAISDLEPMSNSSGPTSLENYHIPRPPPEVAEEFLEMVGKK